MSPTAIPTQPASGGSPTPVGAGPPSDKLARQGVLSASLARNWWLVALRGVFAIGFGILAFALPGVTLLTLVYLFAAYLLVDGVAAIVSAVRAEKNERWGLLLLEGIIDIAAAVAAVVMPGIAILVFVYLVALWSVVSGAFMTVAAFQLGLDHGRWLMAAAGIASVVFGGLLAFAPIAGAVVLALWLGAYAIVFGVMMVVLAFRLRSRHVAGPVSRGV